MVCDESNEGGFVWGLKEQSRLEAGATYIKSCEAGSERKWERRIGRKGRNAGSERNWERQIGREGRRGGGGGVRGGGGGDRTSIVSMWA